MSDTTAHLLDVLTSAFISIVPHLFEATLLSTPGVGIKEVRSTSSSLTYSFRKFSAVLWIKILRITCKSS